MTHRVVKPFPFSGNGYAVENLNAGDERDFGAAADGLLDEGYIVSVGAAPVASVIEMENEAEPVVDAVTEETATEDTAAPRRGRQRRG